MQPNRKQVPEWQRGIVIYFRAHFLDKKGIQFHICPRRGYVRVQQPRTMLRAARWSMINYPALGDDEKMMTTENPSHDKSLQSLLPLLLTRRSVVLLYFSVHYPH